MLQHFTASDGARIAFQVEGEGRPILLLHGLMAHSGFFERQRSLAADFKLVTVDFRGHGQTRDDAHRPTIAQLARDVAELSERLDLHDAIIVGWSLGASVLWELLGGPSATRFAAGVVIDMTPRVMNDEDWQLGLTPQHCADRLHAMEADYPAFASAAGQAIFSPSFATTGTNAEWAAGEFAKNDGRSIAALWNSLVSQDYRAQLRRISQPMLIVHGGQSHLYGPDTAEHLVESLADARAVTFERSGHSPHIEEAERFNQLLREFAATLPNDNAKMLTETGER